MYIYIYVYIYIYIYIYIDMFCAPYSVIPCTSTPLTGPRGA